MPKWTCRNFCYNKYEIYKYWIYLLLSQHPGVSHSQTSLGLEGIDGGEINQHYGLGFVSLIVKFSCSDEVVESTFWSTAHTAAVTLFFL